MKKAFLLLKLLIIALTSLGAFAQSSLEQKMWFIQNNAAKFRINTELGNVSWKEYQARSGIDLQLPSEPIAPMQKIKIGIVEDGFDWSQAYNRKYVSPNYISTVAADTEETFTKLFKQIDISGVAPEVAQKIKNDLTQFKGNLKASDNHGTHIVGVVTSILNQLKIKNGQAQDFFEIVPITKMSNQDKIINTLLNVNNYQFSEVIVRSLIAIYGQDKINSLMDYSVFNDFQNAVNKAIEQKVSILNMSLGIPGNSGFEKIKNSFSDLENNQILLVVSAGNNNSRDIQYPCKHELSICVGSVLPNGDLAYSFTSTLSGGSNYGAGVDVLAPGYQILSSSYTESVANSFVENGVLMTYMNGTSFSSPMVAVQAAILKSIFAAESNNQIKARILSSSRNTQINEASQLNGLSASVFGTVSVAESMQTKAMRSFYKPQLKNNQIFITAVKGNELYQSADYVLNWSCVGSNCQNLKYSIAISQDGKTLVNETKNINSENSQNIQVSHKLVINLKGSGQLKYTLRYNDGLNERIISDDIQILQKTNEMLNRVSLQIENIQSPDKVKQIDVVGNNQVYAVTYQDQINLIDLKTKSVILNQRLPNLAEVYSITLHNQEYYTVLGRAQSTPLGMSKPNAIWYLDTSFQPYKKFRKEIVLDLLDTALPRKAQDIKWVTQNINGQNVNVPVVFVLYPLIDKKFIFDMLPSGYRLAVNNPKQFRKQIISFDYVDGLLKFKHLTDLSFYKNLYKALDLSLIDDVSFMNPENPNSPELSYVGLVTRSNGQAFNVLVQFDQNLQSHVTQAENKYVINASGVNQSAYSADLKSQIVVQEINPLQKIIYYSDAHMVKAAGLVSKERVNSIYSVYRDGDKLFALAVVKSGFDLWVSDAHDNSFKFVQRYLYDFPFYTTPEEYARIFFTTENENKEKIVFADNAFWGGNTLVPLVISQGRIHNKVQYNYEITPGCRNVGFKNNGKSIHLIYRCGAEVDLRVLDFTPEN